MNKIGWLVVMSMSAIAMISHGSAPWSEADRKYLLENLIRSRDELMKETQGLSKQQWAFKESPDRWSISEIVEHLGYWEMLFDHEITNALEAGQQPSRVQTAGPDSAFVNYIMEQNPHHSLDYTKPFSYSIPMGLNELKSNQARFLKMRNESIEHVKTTKDDLRAYFNVYGNIHQIYIYEFGHTDRHLQIRKVKQNARYPRS